MEFSDVLEKKSQPICVAFAFVPANPPSHRAGTALLVTCCSLQQQLEAWCCAEVMFLVSPWIIEP